MFLLPSLLLILACLSGSFGEEASPWSDEQNSDAVQRTPGYDDPSTRSRDLQKKVFVFPASNRKGIVQVNVSLQHPLTSFTMCLRFNPLQIRPYTLFSYYTKPNAKDFQIIWSASDQFILYIGGMTQIIVLPNMLHLGWQHICVAWNSTTGLVHCWHNGEILPRFIMKNGYTLSPNGTMFLGHDPNSLGKRDGFLGEMADFNLWPRVLKPDEINSVQKNKEVPNSSVSWRALNYSVLGGVHVEEALHQVS